MAITLLEAHTAVADPHGDRAWADDKFASRLDLTTLSTTVNTINTKVSNVDGAANTLGFYGATPVAQQTVTGSRTDGTALASLLTVLANLGLIIDASTT